MNKCMVIVDVQKEFQFGGYSAKLFDKEYIRKIKQTIKRNGISSVFFVFDCNSCEINMPIQFLDIENEYNSKRFFKNYAGADIVTIESLVAEGDASIINDEAYSVYGQLVIKTYNHHETQLVNESLKELVDEVKDYDQVFLCGGANGECLHDIEKVFEYFNISFKKKEHLIYPLSSTNTSIEDDEWVEIECPY